MFEIGLSMPDPGWIKGPGEQAEKLIDAAHSATMAVSYKVSLRWVFYRLWQAGDLAHVKATPRASKKENAYSHLKSYCSKAVHFGLLDPDWVADETRGMAGRGGYRTPKRWIEGLMRSRCYIDWWSNQPTYVMIGFEAAAMAQQFEHYTEDYGCKLWPMRGDPSNPYKLQIAETVDWASEVYGVPVVILYFGDLDEKGLSIPEAAFRDVHEWSDSDLTIYRVGLNPGDEDRFDMPDIPGKPGCYQWEALEDIHAEQLIRGGLERFIDAELLNEVKEEETETTERVQGMLQGLLDE